MNKFKLFKINCVIIFLFLSTSVNLFASSDLSRNALLIQQTIKNKVVTVNIKNQPIKTILYEIQKQSGINFAYNEEELAKDMSNLTLNVKDATVENALVKLLESTPYTYAITGNSVTFIKRNNKSQENKKFTIKGKVIDSNTKKPLAGATIIIEGTNDGVISSEDGDYKLNVAVGQSIEVTFIGMKTEVKKIESVISSMDFVLQPDHLAIDDVVITGQANINKNSFTGNAKTIKGDELLSVSRTNVIKAIQSFDPSFRLAENVQFGSDPNSLPEVYIRGRSSIGEMELNKDALSRDNLKNNPNIPTFIMDGFEVSIQKVYDLDPNRIQSLTILKDAAATAMYGSRAANGVIVITTVPPKEGRIRVNYNLTTTFELPDLTDYNLMNSKEKLEAELLSGSFYEEGEDYLGGEKAVLYWNKWNLINIEGVETDWLSKPLRNAFKHQHSLGVEGGTSNIRYGLNMKYSDDNGVMIDSDRENAGVELNLQFNFGKLNIQNTVSFGSTKQNESRFGSFSDYTHKMPYDKTHDDFGNLLVRVKSGGMGEDNNPLYEAELGSFSKKKYEELINNLSIRWMATDHLTISGQLSFTKEWSKGDRFIDPYSLNSTNKPSGEDLLAGDLFANYGDSYDMNARVSISYNRSINKHNLNLNVNGSLLESVSNSMSSHYVGFPSGKLSSVNYATKLYERPQSDEATSRSADVTGIFNYSYDNIYLFDISARIEGSSMFGENNKTSPFWAGGFGINVHNYNFLKDSKVISRLKLRGSFGQVGNINFPPYAAQNYYTMLTEQWYITGYGTRMEYLGNPDLKTERTETLDTGIDIGFFNDRLKFVATYYNKVTRDMINDVTIPSSSGFMVYKDNLGKVLNRGYEFEIYANVIQKKDYSLTLNANLGRNKNTLLEIAQSLKNYNDRINSHYSEENKDSSRSKTKPLLKYEEGGSLTSIIAMRSMGIDPMSGKEIFYDRAGNILYEWTADQQSIVGNTEPKAQGNFGINARYKNFTFYASFAYEFGGQRYNQTLVDHVENAKIKSHNVDKRVLTDRWQKVGDVKALKDIKDEADTKPTSRFVQDYNLLSLSSLSVQYEFGDAFVKKLHLERMRIEASCNDLFRLCSVKQERGLSYPFAKSFNLSLMVNF